MTQYPPPSTQPPYPGAPYTPGGQPAPDPRKAARRASVLMWVLGALSVLFGLFTALALQPMIEWMLTNPPPGQEGQVEQLREQLRQLEAQGLSFGTQALVAGIAMIVVGGLMGVLAFFVRGGSRVGGILSAVLTGLVLAYLALSTVLGIVTSGPQAILGGCVLLVPAALMVLLLVWLIQSLRAPPPGAGMAAMPPGGPHGYGPGYPPAGPQQQFPPAAGSAPSQPPGHHGQPGGAPPGYGFQPPAPPPGQPPVQFGYATKPPAAQPPADGREQPPPAQEPRADDEVNRSPEDTP